MTIHHSSSSSSLEIQPVIYIPINFLESPEVGVLSYPGFLKPCRPLQYPNLDVWYNSICTKIEVQCQHVYIYRDPYSVIKSTTMNRRMNPSTLEAIHLYTTPLHVLHSQLLVTSYSNTLIGCWNYDSILSPIHWKNELNPILQFHNATHYTSALERVYQPKKRPESDEDKRRIVPAELLPYMQTMIRIHEQVVQTCQEQKLQL